MRIADSNVAMASQRRYAENGRQTITSNRQNIVGMMSKGVMTQSQVQNQWADMLQLSTDKDGGGSSLSDTYDKNHGVRKLGRTVNLDDLSANLNSFRDSLLNELLGRFKSIGFDISGLSKQTENGLGIASLSGGGMSFSELSYYEEEYTSFSAEGMAMTEDGRRIDFNVQMEMSRSFALYTKTEIPMLPGVFRDPLVVNVSGNVTSLSDQKFKFDIDMDGILDEISMPTAGSAFLAIDLNEDGKINDGGELFGTASGDGFKDLAKYDSDGSGWIDENDDVFDKLKIWYKNGDGEDELIDLKEADIGAIYLGEQSTTFKLQGADLNTNGMVRSTGIFLHESTGLAGTIQHVDLAVSGRMEASAASAVYAVNDGDEVTIDPNGAGTVIGAADGSENGEASAANVKETQEDSKKSGRESEAERRSRKRLKRKQEEKVRFDKRRAERERMEKLHKKQVERKEEMDARWERKRKERMNSEKAARAERIAEEEQEEIKTRADDEAEQISVTEIGTFEKATGEGVIL